MDVILCVTIASHPSQGAENRPLIERQYQSCHNGKFHSVGESLGRSSLTISLCELTLVSADHRAPTPLHFATAQPRLPLQMTILS